MPVSTRHGSATIFYIGNFGTRTLHACSICLLLQGNKTPPSIPTNIKSSLYIMVKYTTAKLNDLTCSNYLLNRLSNDFRTMIECLGEAATWHSNKGVLQGGALKPLVLCIDRIFMTAHKKLIRTRATAGLWERHGVSFFNSFYLQGPR